ncbi:MAG: alanine--tRNA ligase [Gammaproteobacteria bacterium]|nr:alanine--tRNA ligase [Gammaproteobacteria bacterium]MCY4218301.1 alanine--tRNA ligase [Gammaproteobacteria bacterium]MCY4274310.1 alanine--tRNA ligase [Gammaproteobacteria bacterium]
MKTTQIRRLFLDFFARNGHEIVPSSSLVPGNDQTLLFTNAGMVQFKDVFLGLEKRPYNRAVTAQRCVRAGGKHNDLENVGFTARHHTFFEMLGNFSFGDYFKDEAIRLAWELLTVDFALPAEKLSVTIFEKDDEAESIWADQIGLPSDRITRIGAKDNFWQMGDTGPCGPCSEIFYDHGPEIPGGPPGTPDEDGDRFIEIWNLVFMQYNRQPDGTLVPLPAPSVDTGMGLERIAAVLQHVHSNYEIDLFDNLIQVTAKIIDIVNLNSKSLRVIADHIRSTACLIADGVLPSNEGRGYVLRRIIRRAVRHGYQAGCKEPFMHLLVSPLIEYMDGAIPNLDSSKSHIEKVLKQENEKFNETLEQGLGILDGVIEQNPGQSIPGEIAFRLYDTFGFPIDLTADVVREHGIEVDMEGFHKQMELQRTRAREANRFTQDDSIQIRTTEPTEFVGYETLEKGIQIQEILVDDKPSENISESQSGLLILDRTPFYAESGGQVGDSGEITTESGKFEVVDTRYLGYKTVGHFGQLKSGSISLRQQGRAQVAGTDRRLCANNHSATHLLHAALKSVLGEHVEQKGSLVEPTRLRFDFSHYESINTEQLSQIEILVNDNIRANHSVSVQVMELDKAKEAGAEALFGEKYDDRVRTIRMGEFSFELCGGTHVQRTGDIGYFKIISESAIAAGIRRIEALTGESAVSHSEQQSILIQSIAGFLNSSQENLVERIQSMHDINRRQQKQIQDLQAQLASGEAGQTVHEIGNAKLVIVRMDDSDIKSMRKAVDQWRNRLGSGIAVVGGITEGKVTFIAGTSKDLTQQFSASELISHIASKVGGRGGGRPDMAQGGGPNTDKLEDALNGVQSWIQDNLREID